MTVAAPRFARVIEFSLGSRAYIDKTGDVSIQVGGQAILLRRREFLKLCRAYEVKP